MHIEEVIVDGFKSYATRTVISGFDPRFNAITGLNGSGKSNILDSICFVLGISNLSQVRASNLQELVYKQGQAGVTKASVTIVFNNSDTKSSPVGYEQYDQITVTRQVVIGGRNKYLINGHTAQAGQVQNLFHSVQLNVNNPHFLIMQGRITKVLNMKPPEILGMIEEAAGTRMYENKKSSALKTIEKKQTKVEEINKVLAEEITPTLEKLRGEKSIYLKWASNNTECERLERLCIAHEFLEEEEKLEKSAGDLQGMQDAVDDLKDKQKELSGQIDEKKKAVKELAEHKEREMEIGLKALQTKEESVSKELVQVNSVWQNKKELLKTEEKSNLSLVKQVEEMQQEIKTIENETGSGKAAVEEADSAAKDAQGKLESLQRQLQAVSAGMDADDEDGEGGGKSSLAERLAAKQKHTQELSTKLETDQMKLKHAKDKLTSKEKELKKAQKEGQSLKTQIETVQQDVEEMTKELGAIAYNEKQEKALWDEKTKLEGSVNELRERVNELEAQLSSRLKFEYSAPSRNFKPESVHGVVAKLLTIKDMQWATALEVAAGGKLYQVVVDTEQTGKELLKNGKLRTRVTIVPLNKIASKTIPEEKVAKAKHIAQSILTKKRKGGDDLVFPALSLVGYSKDVERAMEYVFGSTFVVENMEVGKAITFDKDIKTKTVTKDGDSFDPSGTLQGGSRRSTTPILVRLQALTSASVELGEQQEKLRKVVKALDELKQSQKMYKTLSQKAELKSHELNILLKRREQSVHYQLEEETKALRTMVDDIQNALAETKMLLKQTQKESEELEAKIKDIQASREKQIARLEKEIANAKKQAAAKAKEAEQKRGLIEDRLLEAEKLTSEIASMREQIASGEAEIETIRQAVNKLGLEVAKGREDYEKARAALEAKKQELESCDGDLKKLTREERALAEKLNEAELESRKLEHKISRFNKEKGLAKKTVVTMLKKYPWIESERQFFGQPHTDYDFEARNPSQARKILQKLQEQQASLSKKINKKVMGMIEKAESEYNSLMKKRQIIEKDKEKIESVIEELDNKKNEALKTTWSKVNKDFGSIFSTLLPGTKAKLEPPEGSTVADGLEVKVAFGEVWKESLTELSGGQRSLLALSLILSLLLFKPAPMYILDEVDAALDLSHTQNIGQMIRNHFSHSQFIVVSLKEGMFNNANVIFRTKFVDGVSTVMRTTPNQRDLMASDKENADMNILEKDTKKTKRGGARAKQVL